MRRRWHGGVASRMTLTREGLRGVGCRFLGRLEGRFRAGRLRVGCLEGRLRVGCLERLEEGLRCGGAVSGLRCRSLGALRGGMRRCVTVPRVCLGGGLCWLGVGSGRLSACRVRWWKV